MMDCLRPYGIVRRGPRGIVSLLDSIQWRITQQMDNVLATREPGMVSQPSLQDRLEREKEMLEDRLETVKSLLLEMRNDERLAKVLNNLQKLGHSPY